MNIATTSVDILFYISTTNITATNVNIPFHATRYGNISASRLYALCISIDRYRPSALNLKTIYIAFDCNVDFFFV